MTRKLKFVALGDFHWGAVPTERLEQEFEQVLMPWLEANEFDALLQLGDWFDKRLSLDSTDAKAAMRAIVRLCQLCQGRGVPLRIVRGTISHDFTQMQNYVPLETEYPVFRVIQSAQHEELLPGFDVLWVPEESPTDYEDYYGRLLFDGDEALVYDAILGHGEIDVAAGWSQMSEGERHYGVAPTHSAELLLQHSSGPVYFGHIHTRFQYKKRLGYPGSFTRWCHGEEATKGFDVLDLTEKQGGWTVKTTQVQNPLAPLYRTVIAEQILSPVDPADEIVRKLRDAAEGMTKLRVKFAGFPIGVEELMVVRGAMADDPRIQFQTEARPLLEAPGEVEGEEGEAEASEERQARLSYLRDPALTPQERLHRYITEHAVDSCITLDDVAELTAPLVT